MTTIVGLSGSLRRASYNTALLQSAISLMPEGAELHVRTIHDIPLYNGDEEALAGVPAAVRDLKESIAAADGLILATPEYNHSIPGPLKNAIDWLSRPATDIARVFRGMPVALIGASTGSSGTMHSQKAWLPILNRLGTKPWLEGQLLVPDADEAFDVVGNLTDKTREKQLQAFLAGFIRFVGSNRALK